MSQSLVNVTVQQDEKQKYQQYQKNIELAKEDGTLSPETGKRLSKGILARFGLGFFLFGLCWMIGINAVTVFIVPLRLKQMVNNPAAIISINGVVSSLVTLIINLVIGNLSDQTRSKYGRRTPWIISGALISAIFMYLTGTAPNVLSLIIFFGVAMGGLTMMLSPAIAVLADRLPQNIRGTMSACFSIGSGVGAPAGTFIGSALVKNIFLSSLVSGIFMLLSGFLLVMIFPREPSATFFPKPKRQSLKALLLSFKPPRFSSNHDFYKAFCGRVLLQLGWQMIAAYQLYIMTDYIELSTTQAAQAITIMSVISMIVNMVGPVIGGPLSDILKTRKIPILIAAVLFVAGIIIPRFMPSVLGMYLYAGIAGLGWGIYGSVDQALNVDVLSSSKEAGKDLGILNLATSAGQMIGPILTASIVTMTGSYSLSFVVSIVMGIIGASTLLAIKSVK